MKNKIFFFVLSKTFRIFVLNLKQIVMSNSNSTSGIGLFTVLGLIFVVLKLCNLIDWSWWWVTLPFWGGAALVIGILLIVALIAFIFRN